VLPGSVLGAALLLISLPAAAQAPPARVEVASVRAAPLEHAITLSGNIRSPQTTELSAQIDGYITQVRVLPGDRVSAGQVAITLDDELPQLELKRLRSALREAETLYRDQQRRTREAQGLIADNNVSRSEYETLQAETLAGESRVEMIRLATTMQEIRVQHHTVSVPFAGVVTAKLVEEGQRISGDTPLMHIASMDPLWADVRLPERYLSQVKEGSPVRIRTASGDEEGLASSVKWVVPVSADGSRTFLVRSEFSNPGWQFAPGMSARVELALARESNQPTLQVPADAIVRSSDGRLKVWVVARKGDTSSASPRGVTLGRRDGNLVELLGGEVAEGDEVVVRGNEALENGQAVIVQRREES
jgi:RND family efflux transporter MFP subunit